MTVATAVVPSQISAIEMKCRVCASPVVTKVGSAQYYRGVDCDFYDCGGCGCRFAKHDRLGCETLHSERESYYGSYRELASKCSVLFDAGDLRGLKEELSQISKYRFVIDEIEGSEVNGNLLEVGCSRGYLTAYFILAGYRVLGADASPTALAGARQLFGNHFAPADSPTVSEGAPYDVIYHVGTIGCVEDPIGLTNRLLAMLKPGGMILFNAPNRDSLWLRGQLWIDATPPPDVVTVFPPGFWKKTFGGIAEIEEQIETCPADQSVTIGIGKLLGRQWKQPAPIPLGRPRWECPRDDSFGERLMLLMEGGARRTGRITGLSRFVPKQPYEFGLMVKMTKK